MMLLSPVICSFKLQLKLLWDGQVPSWVRAALNIQFQFMASVFGEKEENAALLKPKNKELCEGTQSIKQDTWNPGKSCLNHPCTISALTQKQLCCQKCPRGCWDSPSPASSLPDESPGKYLLPALLPLSEHKGSCSSCFKGMCLITAWLRTHWEMFPMYQSQLPPWKRGGAERWVLPSLCTQGRAGSTQGQGTEGQGCDNVLTPLTAPASSPSVEQSLTMDFLCSKGWPPGTTMCVWPQGCSSANPSSLTSFPVPTECWQLSFHFVFTISPSSCFSNKEEILGYLWLPLKAYVWQLKTWQL